MYYFTELSPAQHFHYLKHIWKHPFSRSILLELISNAFICAPVTYVVVCGVGRGVRACVCACVRSFVRACVRNFERIVVLNSNYSDFFSFVNCISLWFSWPVQLVIYCCLYLCRPTALCWCAKNAFRLLKNVSSVVVLITIPEATLCGWRGISLE